MNSQKYIFFQCSDFEMLTDCTFLWCDREHVNHFYIHICKFVFFYIHVIVYSPLITDDLIQSAWTCSFNTFYFQIYLWSSHSERGWRHTHAKWDSNQWPIPDSLHQGWWTIGGQDLILCPSDASYDSSLRMWIGTAVGSLKNARSRSRMCWINRCVTTTQCNQW